MSKLNPPVLLPIHYPKYTRGQAYDVILKMMADAEDESTKRELMGLAYWFAPTHPKKPNTAFQWLSNVASLYDADTYKINLITVLKNHGVVSYSRPSNANSSFSAIAANDLKDNFYHPKIERRADIEDEVKATSFKERAMDSLVTVQRAAKKRSKYVKVNKNEFFEALELVVLKRGSYYLFMGYKINKRVFDMLAAECLLEIKINDNDKKLYGRNFFGSFIMTVE